MRLSDSGRWLAAALLLLHLAACSSDDSSAADDEPAPEPPAVCQAPAPADMTGAVNFGNGTPGSCTPAALQTLLTAGGKIKCNCGPNPVTVTLTEALIVPNKEVILDGDNKLTISGNNQTRIFRKEPAANQNGGSLFGLQNLRLINARVTEKSHSGDLGGAAIASRGAFGSLRVFHVEFTNNQTLFANSILNPGNGRSVNADACGAVHTILYKEVLFVGCTFTGNRGANGGAVGTIGSGSTFINCRFTDNEAYGTDGTFERGGSGGAIYVDGVNQNGVNNTYAMCGSTFVNNRAGHQGGAVNVIFYAGEGSRATVDKCSFEGSRAAVDKGGAYYHMNGPLALTNSTFADNEAPGAGGGIWMNNTSLTLTNTTFVNNRSTNGLGGGLAYDGNGAAKDARVMNCTFSGNRAGIFASAIFTTGNLTLANSLFANNLTGTGQQSNPFGGGTINKGSNLTVGVGNFQFPRTYTTNSGNQVEDWITADVRTDNPNLQALADNGGPTRTMALPSNSPAKDAGTASGAPTTDQRGRPRQGTPDSGAFEVQ